MILQRLPISASKVSEIPQHGSAMTFERNNEVMVAAMTTTAAATIMDLSRNFGN